jgi:hypothetical protein
MPVGMQGPESLKTTRQHSRHLPAILYLVEHEAFVVEEVACPEILDLGYFRRMIRKAVSK